MTTDNKEISLCSCGCMQPLIINKSIYYNKKWYLEDHVRSINAQPSKGMDDKFDYSICKKHGYLFIERSPCPKCEEPKGMVEKEAKISKEEWEKTIWLCKDRGHKWSPPRKDGTRYCLACLAEDAPKEGSSSDEINKAYETFMEGCFIGKGENVTDDGKVVFTKRGTLDEDEIKKRLEWVLDEAKLSAKSELVRVPSIEEIEKIIMLRSRLEVEEINKLALAIREMMLKGTP